jgi:hypothetical protein
VVGQPCSCLPPNSRCGHSSRAGLRLHPQAQHSGEGIVGAEIMGDREDGVKMALE